MDKRDKLYAVFFDQELEVITTDREYALNLADNFRNFVKSKVYIDVYEPVDETENVFVLGETIFVGEN